MTSPTSSSATIATAFHGPPTPGLLIPTTRRCRFLVGWIHQDDTPAGLLQGQLWCCVNSTRVQGFHVYDKSWNRSPEAGVVVFCGHANFTMVRMFHPHWCVNGKVPEDMNSLDKEVLRVKYWLLWYHRRAELVAQRNDSDRLGVLPWSSFAKSHDPTGTLNGLVAQLNQLVKGDRALSRIQAAADIASQVNEAEDEIVNSADRLADTVQSRDVSPLFYPDESFGGRNDNANEVEVEKDGDIDTNEVEIEESIDIDHANDVTQNQVNKPININNAIPNSNNTTNETEHPQDANIDPRLLDMIADDKDGPKMTVSTTTYPAEGELDIEDDNDVTEVKDERKPSIDSIELQIPHKAKDLSWLENFDFNKAIDLTTDGVGELVSDDDDDDEEDIVGPFANNPKAEDDDWFMVQQPDYLDLDGEGTKDDPMLLD